MATMAKHRTTSGAGPSQRQLRVGELIRRTLSDILNRAEIHDPDLNAMSITVGEVRCSPDLKIATAYVMPLGGTDATAAIALLKRHQPALRHHIAQALTLKYAPDLRFLPDETYARLEATRRLFANETVQRDIAGGSGHDSDDRED